MATDQEIRDAGFKYIPQQQYLQNPFELPAADPVTDQGIVATNAFTGGGGDGFSVYNPDPNSIVNKNYRPNYDYRQFVDGYDPNLSATMNMKMMEVDPNYKGADYYNKPPSKMDGLMSMVPYVGSLMKGVNFLGDQISSYFPVNRRSILENELGGQGIMVNDIGQIVQGQGAYDTAANVMTGYNANKMTAETFDKRIAEATKKMSDTNIDPNTGKTYKEARIAALEAAKADFLNAQDQTDKIYDFEEDEKKKKKKDTIISRFITKKKEAKAVKDAAAADASSTDTGGGYTGTPGGNTGSGNFSNIDNSGKDYGPYSNNNSSSGSYSNKGGGASYSNSSPTNVGNPFGYMDGGRAGYFYGGRVNFKNGGLASIL